MKRKGQKYKRLIEMSANPEEIRCSDTDFNSTQFLLEE